MDPQKERALQRLLEGANQSQVAREVGVHRSTVIRWIKGDPLFREALEAAETVDAKQGLERLVPDAIKVLEEGLAGKKTAAQTRVALDIIKAAAQVGKLGDDADKGSGLARRLMELDARTDGQPAGDSSALPD